MVIVPEYSTIIDSEYQGLFFTQFITEESKTVRDLFSIYKPKHLNKMILNVDFCIFGDLKSHILVIVPVLL